mgnify:CR=1 FL=1
MPKPWMIYGANGYTGELIAREAAGRGLQVLVAGAGGAAHRPSEDAPQHPHLRVARELLPARPV